MNYSFFLSHKYLFAKKDRFVSTINLVSVTGLAIGVTALIVVIGVMAGFNKDLREKILGTNAHIVIERQIGIKDYLPLRNKILNVEGVKGVTPYINGNVFLERGSRAHGLILRGIDPQYESSVTRVQEYLNEGDIQNLGPLEVIIGTQLANYFGLRVGDMMTILAPASGVAGEGWRYQMKVAGTFTSGMYDYDMNLILVNLAQAQQIFQLGDDMATGLAVNINNVDSASVVKEAIQKEIGFAYVTRTWIENNENFFKALALEKFAMFIILTLIVLVASFNIASTLIVTVTSKTKDIGILKSIGVPSNAIRRIFTFQGLGIGLMGTFWGLVGGLGLSYILKNFQFIELPQDIYYIDKLPILLQWSDVLIIIGSAIFISYMATWYPANKAASLKPVEALRYE